MDKNVKAVFDRICTDIAIDASLCKRINEYLIRFINRNSDYVTFFGGALTGVQVVRFSSNDRNDWFNNILEVDELDLEEALHSLPTINPKFNVSSDVFNLSCLWLAFAIGRNAKLNKKLVEEAQFNIMMILNIKLLTSLLYNYFKYPADEAVAKATYDALSYKFALKQLGSWYKVMEERSRDILSPGSIHAKVIREFDKDERIVYAINDIQGRIRDMIKNIYDVFDKVHKQGMRIASNSAIVEHDGVEVLKDRTKSLTLYTRYLMGILPDENSLMKEDLLQVIERLMKTMPPKLFRETLTWLSSNYPGHHSPLVEQTISELLVHAFDYLKANRFLMRNTTDMATLLTKLKGTYMSSRNTDVNLKLVKENTEKIVVLATSNKNDSIIASVRTGVMLYLVVRAISMKYYSQ